MKSNHQNVSVAHARVFSWVFSCGARPDFFLELPPRIWYIDNGKRKSQRHMAHPIYSLYFISRQLFGVVGGYFFPLHISIIRAAKVTMNIPIWIKSWYVTYIGITLLSSVRRAVPSVCAKGRPPILCTLTFREKSISHFIRFFKLFSFEFQIQN